MEDPSCSRSVPTVIPSALTVEQATLRSLSERFVTLHRGLRVLETIAWEDDIEAAFFASGCRANPRVDPAWYHSLPLPFDPDTRQTEFRQLEREIRQSLGVAHPGSQLLLRRCREARQVIDLLAARGTSEFGTLSERLYGDILEEDGLSARLHRLAERLGPVSATVEDAATFDGIAAVRYLQERLTAFFGSERLVRVRPTDDLTANAAASFDTIKVRRDATFTPREVRLLEVHEGWVHLGTTLNGQSQPICTFLSKCLPSTTTTQEGLAVMVEVLAGVSHSSRLDRLALRVEGIAWAKAGADFVQVFEAFRERAMEPRDAYRQTARIFRGVPTTGGSAFAKDACYARGFVSLARMCDGDDLTLLTVGKTRREELPLLRELLDTGLLRGPRFVPPVFAAL